MGTVSAVWGMKGVSTLGGHREGMHYGPRRWQGFGGHGVLTVADMRYRAALGIGPAEALPAAIGQCVHNRPRKPGESLPDA